MDTFFKATKRKSDKQNNESIKRIKKWDSSSSEEEISKTFNSELEMQSNRLLKVTEKKNTTKQNILNHNCSFNHRLALNSSKNKRNIIDLKNHNKSDNLITRTGTKLNKTFRFDTESSLSNKGSLDNYFKSNKKLHNQEKLKKNNIPESNIVNRRANLDKFLITSGKVDSKHANLNRINVVCSENNFQRINQTKMNKNYRFDKQRSISLFSKKEILNNKHKDTNKNNECIKTIKMWDNSSSEEELSKIFYSKSKTQSNRLLQIADKNSTEIKHLNSKNQEQKDFKITKQEILNINCNFNNQIALNSSNNKTKRLIDLKKDNKSDNVIRRTRYPTSTGTNLNSSSTNKGSLMNKNYRFDKQSSTSLFSKEEILNNSCNDTNKNNECIKTINMWDDSSSEEELFKIFYSKSEMQSNRLLKIDDKKNTKIKHLNSKNQQQKGIKITNQKILPHNCSFNKPSNENTKKLMELKHNTAHTKNNECIKMIKMWDNSSSEEELSKIFYSKSEMQSNRLLKVTDRKNTQIKHLDSKNQPEHLFTNTKLNKSSFSNGKMLKCSNKSQKCIETTDKDDVEYQNFNTNNNRRFENKNVKNLNTTYKFCVSSSLDKEILENKIDLLESSDVAKFNFIRDKLTIVTSSSEDDKATKRTECSQRLTKKINITTNTNIPSSDGSIGFLFDNVDKGNTGNKNNETLDLEFLKDDFKHSLFLETQQNPRNTQINQNVKRISQSLNDIFTQELETETFNKNIQNILTNPASEFIPKNCMNRDEAEKIDKTGSKAIVNCFKDIDNNISLEETLSPPLFLETLQNFEKENNFTNSSSDCIPVKNQLNFINPKESINLFTIDLNIHSNLHQYEPNSIPVTKQEKSITEKINKHDKFLVYNEEKCNPSISLPSKFHVDSCDKNDSTTIINFFEDINQKDNLKNEKVNLESDEDVSSPILFLYNQDLISTNNTKFKDESHDSNKIYTQERETEISNNKSEIIKNILSTSETVNIVNLQQTSHENVASETLKTIETQIEKKSQFTQTESIENDFSFFMDNFIPNHLQDYNRNSQISQNIIKDELIQNQNPVNNFVNQDFISHINTDNQYSQHTKNNEPTKNFVSTELSSNISDNKDINIPEFITKKQKTNLLKTAQENTNSLSILEDEQICSILNTEYQRFKQKEALQCWPDDTEKKLFEKLSPENRLNNNCIKRYRRGNTKIYRFKNVKKPTREPKGNIINSNETSILEELTQDFIDPGRKFNRANSCSSVSTSSSYITDESCSDVLSTGSKDLSRPQIILRAGLNDIAKDKTLLCDEEEKVFSNYNKSEIKSKIQNILVQVFDDFKNKKKSSFTIPTKSIRNCVYQNGRLQLQSEDKLSTTCISSSNKRNARFKLILLVLKKVQTLLETDTKLLKRELYYQLKNMQCCPYRIDQVLYSISMLLNVGRWALNIVAQKGLVFGDLKILQFSGEIINCNVPGTLIPQDVEDIFEFHSNAYFILVVEKESIFCKLIEEGLLNKLTRPFIMITGKGFPDINTQLFVRKLWIALSIPVFILVDADPYGIQIMLTYRFGSIASAHVSEYLAVPKAKWLGIYPSEVKNYDAPEEPLTAKDVKMIQTLLEMPYMVDHPGIVNELNLMLKNNSKAGIESLIKSLVFLSDIYLPSKFYTRHFI